MKDYYKKSEDEEILIVISKDEEIVDPLNVEPKVIIKNDPFPNSVGGYGGGNGDIVLFEIKNEKNKRNEEDERSQRNNRENT